MVEELGKSYDTIKLDLNQQVDLNDKFDWRWKNSLAIIDWAISILNKYEKEDWRFIGDLSGKDYFGGDIINEYENLRRELEELKQHYEWWNTNFFALIGNKAVERILNDLNEWQITLIDKLVYLINEAENKVLLQKEIVKDRTRVQELIILTNENTTAIWNQYIQRAELDGSGEWLVFLEESNGKGIEEVMQEFFKRYPDEQYEIDYSKCHDENLKKKIYERLGCYTTIIQFDKERKICPLIAWDKEGAPIWSGVIIQSLTSERLWLKAAELEEQDKMIDYNEKYKTLEDARELEALIPEDLKKRLKEKNLLLPFIIKCETRLDGIVKGHKRQQHRLYFSDPIDTGWAWFMKARFNNWTFEESIFNKPDNLWTDESMYLSQDMYEILDDEDDDLELYLAQRIKLKREELDFYEHRNIIIDSFNVEGEIDDTEKTYQENQLFAIDCFVETLKNIQNKWYNGYLQKLLMHCKDMQYSLQKINASWQKVDWNNWENQTKKIKDLFREYYNNDWSNAGFSDADANRYISIIFNRELCKWLHNPEDFSSYMKENAEIEGDNLKDKKEEIWFYTRKLTSWLTFWGNAYASNITESIGHNALEHPENYDIPWKEYLTKIMEKYKTDIGPDWEITGNKEEIDNLFKHLGSPENLYNYLFLCRQLPQNIFWVNVTIGSTTMKIQDNYSILGQYQKNIINSIYKQLKLKKETSEKVNITPSDIRGRLEAQNKFIIWNNSPLTEAQKTQIRINEMAMSDEDALEKMAQQQTDITRKTLKYWWVDKILVGSMFNGIIFTQWIGDKTQIQRVFADAIWKWFWDLSDDTRETIVDVWKDLIIDFLLDIALFSVGVWLIKYWLKACNIMSKFWEMGKKIVEWSKKSTKIYDSIKTTKTWKFIWKVTKATAETTVRNTIEWEEVNLISTIATAWFGTLTNWANILLPRGINIDYDVARKTFNDMFARFKSKVSSTINIILPKTIVQVSESESENIVGINYGIVFALLDTLESIASLENEDIKACLRNWKYELQTDSAKKQITIILPLKQGRISVVVDSSWILIKQDNQGLSEKILKFINCNKLKNWVYYFPQHNSK